HRPDHLDATTQVAIHPVGAADEDLRVAAVLEIENAAVLQKPVDDTGDANVLTDPRQPRPQCADAAAEDVDLHARLAGAIQRLHHRRFEQTIDLGHDAALLAGLLVGHLLLNPLDHERLHPAGRDHQLAPLRQ